MSKQIDIFDFDGTLFRSPTDTPENQRKYEESTGIPWLINKEQARALSNKLGRPVGMRRGWYGRAETLEPPLVPDPAPDAMFIPQICEEFLESKNDPERQTVILTGRHAGLEPQVLRILGDGGLVEVAKSVSKRDGKTYFASKDPFVYLFFLGQSGPSPRGFGPQPHQTLPWKIWIMKQLVQVNPAVERIEIWEDREEHVIEFEKLEEEFDPVEVEVHFVR